MSRSLQNRIDGTIAILASLISIMLVFGGCVYGPSSDQLRALTESKRSWCLTQSNVYVPFLMIGGTGIEGGKMECTRDGFKVDDKALPASLPSSR